MNFRIWILCFICISNVKAQDNIELDNLFKTIVRIDYDDILNDSLSSVFDDICDKKVILLGEMVHTDETTQLMKNRIIKLLHEKYNYNVLIEETSFFNTSLNYKTLKSNDEFKWFYAAIKGDYSLSNSEIERIDYLWNTKIKQDTLHYFGLDIWISNNRQITFNFIDSILNKFGHYIVSDLDREKVEKYILSYDIEFLVEHYSFFDDTINKILYYYQEKDVAFQILKNIRAFYEYKVNSSESKNVNKYNNSGKIFDSYLTRDKQMADNVFWLLKYKYPNEKIIISTSTYHISKNLEQIKSKNKFFNTGVPMGQYLYNQYKDSIYTIAFIIGEGNVGFFKNNCSNNKYSKEIFSKLPTKKSRIESILIDRGYNYAFATFNQNISNEMSFYMHPTFHKSYKYNWSNVYESLFFIKEAKPIHQKSIFCLYSSKHHESIKEFINQF
ncbi:MAG: erythromycin esterase family protein [Cyclobacteriaceae bacterium]